MMEAWKPRAARPEELGQVRDLAQKVFRPGNPVTMGDLFPILWNDGNAVNTRIISDDQGRVVSHIGLWISEMVIGGTRIGSASIGAVCSDDSIRGKGHGTALLMDAFDHCRGLGVDAITISGGRGLYTRNECREVGTLLSYELSPEQAFGLSSGLGTAGAGLGVVEAAEADVPDLASLYSMEPVRFSRTLDDFRAAVAARTYPGVHNREQIILLARRGGAPAAYLAMMKAADTGAITCFEYAGERCAVIAMISRMASGHPTSTVGLRVPAWDTAMANLLKVCAAPPPVEGHVPGTHFITDPVRLFGNLGRYFGERMGACMARDLSDAAPVNDGRGVVLRVMGQEEEFRSRSEVIDLVFGTGAMKDRVEKLGGPLGEALKAAFPLPMPNPEGITYI